MILKKLLPKTPLALGRPKDASKRVGIIRAATALFMKQGFELTSMEAVAKKAGVSKLTIYSHFANKIDLFQAVIRQRCDELALPESFQALAQMPVEQGLLKLGHLVVPLIYSADSTRLQRIMLAESAQHPEIIKIFYKSGPMRVRESFGALLQAWQNQGQLVVPDIARATEQFFSLLKGETYTKVLLQLEPKMSAEAMQQHIAAAVSLFLAGYRPHTTTGGR